MLRSHAKYLSETISNEAIFDMLQRAKNEITDWTKPAKANALFSRGKFWNMFHCADFNIKVKYQPIIKYRLIEEFGEFLPDKYKPLKKKKIDVETYHEDPIF